MTRTALWHREGMLVSVKEGHAWWASHAQQPTALPLSDRLWRIYFGARDRDNRMRILAVDVDPGDGMRVVSEHFDPILDLGPLAAFDREGVAPSSALMIDAQVFLYYTGIIVRRDVRAQVSIGLAISDDGLNFRRAFPGPIFGVGPFDPYYSGVPTVRRTESGYYRMWYVGGNEWQRVNGVLEPFYEIRTTRSPDGLAWDARSNAAMPQGPGNRDGLGRPWIVEESDGLRLWFSRRGRSYRSSGAGAYRLSSVRLDGEGFACGAEEDMAFDNPPAAGDFDSWMQAYSCILPYRDELIMFYNGNDFGKEGFGWARLPRGTLPHGGA